MPKADNGTTKPLVFKNSSLRARRIFVNIPPTQDYSHSTFEGNRVTRSKYTIWNFIPKNIWEQFNRFANIYFLSLVLLQLISAFKEVEFIVAAMPVIIIVASTALRDALEDYKRHQADKMQNLSKVAKFDGPNYNFENSNPIKKKTKSFDNSLQPMQKQTSEASLSLCSLATRKWVDTTWASLRVGDFVYLKNNELIPADLLIISTSEPESTCFVETKNLDGETNLKIKRGVTELSYINTLEDISSLKCHIDAEMPNPNLYTFNGAIVIPDFTKEEPNVVPIGPNGIALRGCTLR